jgi:sugar lactone lactonase YvrE
MSRQRAPHRLLIAAAALAAAGTPLAAGAAQADYLGPIGHPGVDAGSLAQPWGIAAAPDGRIYVTETGRGRVSVFDSAGRVERTFGALAGASGIAVGPGGVYVVERDAHRVAHYTADGGSLGTFGGKGVGNGQFQTPEDVALQGNNVIVTSQYRFQRFTPAGAFIDGHGGAGPGLGDFEGLRGVATTADGGIFTTETTNHRVQRFSSAFAPLSAFGEKGLLDGQLTTASGIAADAASSSVWVTDLATGKTQRFGFGGQLRDVIGRGPANAPEQIVAPSDVAVDCRGTVYIVDAASERVQRFGSAEAASAGNLLHNGGFEEGGASCDSTPATVGSGPGWSTGGGGATAVHYGAAGGFPSRADGESGGGGQSFLAGGPNRAKVVTDQTVDVSAQALDIDDGRRLARLSGRLGGFTSQDDQATVEAVYKDAAGAPISTTTIGPVTAADRGGKTALLARDAAATVPKGTRSITVRVSLTRAGTSGYDDAYADRLALTLTPQRPNAAAPPAGPVAGQGGPGRDVTAPRIALRGVATANAARTGRLVVSVGCGERCALRVTAGRGARTLASVTTRPAATRRITLRLSQSSRAALRAALRSTGRAAVVLRVTATDAAGNRARVARTFTVRR